MEAEEMPNAKQIHYVVYTTVADNWQIDSKFGRQIAKNHSPREWPKMGWPPGNKQIDKPTVGPPVQSPWATCLWVNQRLPDKGKNNIKGVPQCSRVLESHNLYEATQSDSTSTLFKPHVGIDGHRFYQGSIPQCFQAYFFVFISSIVHFLV
jgi:hypothetical protein